MASNVETGFLVLADITGYTAYLSRGEIEHAPAIAGDLLETVVGRLEPPFRLAKLEGDAVFVFAEDGRADPALLIDAVKAAYVAFRGRLRSIEGATACECNACGLAPKLDLKVFVHHGSYVHSRIAGRDELAGTDVIVVHRLLKSTAAQQRPGSGFALFTQAAVEALGMEPAVLRLEPSIQLLEDMQPVQAHVMDLEQRWATESARRRLMQPPLVPVIELVASLPTDPATAWGYLTSPALRAQWEGAISIEETAADGLRGVGTTTRCVTGRLATLEEIVDWQPYDYVGWRVARPGIGQLEAVADLSPTERGTQIRLRWALPVGSPAPVAELERLRKEKTLAFERLVREVS